MKFKENKIISKQLLGVLIKASEPIQNIKENTEFPNYIYYGYGDNCEYRINTHELANKAKEWAWEQGYQIMSSYKSPSCNDEPYAEVIEREVKTYKDEEIRILVTNQGGDTEKEAIFNSCEWILSTNN